MIHIHMRGCGMVPLPITFDNKQYKQKFVISDFMPTETEAIFENWKISREIDIYTGWGVPKTTRWGVPKTTGWGVPKTTRRGA